MSGSGILLLPFIGLILFLALIVAADELIGWVIAHKRLFRRVAAIALIVAGAGWLGIFLALVTR